MPLAPRLGLRENLPQFLMLVFVNALVGAMIGLERTILPKLAQEEFQLQAHAAILSFIAVFGVSKAICNYFAGSASDRFGRKPVLIFGWVASLPVPLLLIWAPTWGWVLFANLLLGASQGLTWSTTVIMKIDLVGPKQRGLAMGLNEFAGYLAVAISAFISAKIASLYGTRPEPFILGILYGVLGLAFSLFIVKETKAFAAHESSSAMSIELPSSKEIFLKTTFSDRNLSSATQAGFVNNLNDGAIWGLFPVWYAQHSMSLEDIGLLAGIYLSTWGFLQIFSGHLSDKFGRKIFISSGMSVQAVGIALAVLTPSYYGFFFGAVLIGIGTAMVYPTLLASIGDVTHPQWRASAIGVYRLWRDFGYAAGAVLSGLVADFFGIAASLLCVSLLTLFSGIVVALRMREKLL